MTLHPDADAAAGTMLGMTVSVTIAIISACLWTPALVFGIPFAMLGFIFALIDYMVLTGRM